MWSVLSFPGLESSRGQGRGRLLQSLMQPGSHRVDREGPWDPQWMELGHRVLQRAMLGSAAHYSAFARGGKEPQTTTTEKSSLSTFTGIHMAINKTSCGFCAWISRHRCQNIREQVQGTQPNFTGLVHSGRQNFRSRKCWFLVIYGFLQFLL